MDKRSGQQGVGFGEQGPVFLSFFPTSCASMSHSNHTLRFMSFPVSDISQAYRSAPERTEDVWQKVVAYAGWHSKGQGPAPICRP